MASVEVVDKIGSISFTRTNGKILNGTCHACASRRIPDTEMGLLIDMDSVAFALCSFHEGMLLEKLLTNYLKRIARGSKAGFIAPITKEKETATNA